MAVRRVTWISGSFIRPSTLVLISLNPQRLPSISLQTMPQHWNWPPKSPRKVNFYPHEPLIPPIQHRIAVANSNILRRRHRLPPAQLHQTLPQLSRTDLPGDPPMKRLRRDFDVYLSCGAEERLTHQCQFCLYRLLLST